MAWIEASDFTGAYKLPADTFNTTITTISIQEMRDPAIRKVFGATLGDLIIDYVDNPPMTSIPEYDAVIDPFSVDSYCHGILESIGLKDCIKGFIYWKRMCDAKLQVQTVAGVSRPKTENSTPDVLPQFQLLDRYNTSVKSIWAIQRYISDNSAEYPNYNGQKHLLNYVL